MDIVHVKWNGKRRFVAWDEAGHGIVMDASAGYKGDGSGARPVELVLYGLAGCTGMDVISILEKKRQKVTDFDLVVTGTQRTDEYPKIYTRIEVEYVITGIDVKPEAVARAIELSEDKYCSVKGMFGSDVEVVTSYRVLEAEC
ncbi:MAG: OsmC family protein [Coriobacteriia bacterium]|nr:OsmC family protein [Coriobacteriia bacterium]